MTSELGTCCTLDWPGNAPGSRRLCGGIVATVVNGVPMCGAHYMQHLEMENKRLRGGAPSPAVARLVEACRDSLDWLELPGNAVEERAVAVKMRKALAAVEKEIGT